MLAMPLVACKCNLTLKHLNRRQTSVSAHNQPDKLEVLDRLLELFDWQLTIAAPACSISLYIKHDPRQLLRNEQLSCFGDAFTFTAIVGNFVHMSNSTVVEF